MEAPAQPPSSTSREDIASSYLEQLAYDLYPVQEEALLAWFTADQGVLVCAPTGTGKTLIAEAALYEALHTGRVAYYTTPLIALTEQKFQEMQQRAVDWGFEKTDVGLVTGNRRENPQARILVVVAEILLNRLLHRDAFDFEHVESVVMDEFHSFADRERGIVWELTLGLLPTHVRTLLLSATVGNALEFSLWLKRQHQRDLQLVEGTDRRVPLTYHWIGDQLLSEQLVQMAAGDEQARRTPALIFCFNREECWNVAEQLKGKKLIDGDRQQLLVDELQRYDWSAGAGPKLRQILLRGVGVHHAGVLPKYRRIVEDLFQRKLLSVTVCTETLAAGINLPARSVVIPTLVKGPPDNKKLIDASSAHQIFGRAGRPQFDDQGFVYVLAHEDDVKHQRWREKYDQIPEDTKDPGLRRAKKALKKKMPRRRANQHYWTEQQFQKLCDSPPGKLYSKGPLPWRLLAHVLEASPEVALIRELVSKRLMDTGRLSAGQKQLTQLLLTLWRAGYVELKPKPPPEPDAESPAADAVTPPHVPPPDPAADTLFGMTLGSPTARPAAVPTDQTHSHDAVPHAGYQPEFAYPTPDVAKLNLFRSVNPLYGVFLINQLGIANRDERIQAMESVLELPGSVAHFVRVPPREQLPPGPLAIDRLDAQLLRLGLVTEEDLLGSSDDDDSPTALVREPRRWPLTLSQKLRLLFDYDFPGVNDVRTQSVWAVGELLCFGGNFNKFVLSRRLQKQEGVVFRHFLRFILLLGEFMQLCPPDAEPDDWQDDLADIKAQLIEACQAVDPLSTQKTLQSTESVEDVP